MPVNETKLAQTTIESLAILRDKASLVLDEARRLGADQAEVGISLSEGFSVTVRLGEVETLEFHRDRGFGVTVYQGQRKGFASSTDDAETSLRETVAAAVAIARQTQPDPCAGLAPPEWLAREIPDLDLFHPWDLSPADAIESASACEAAGRADPRICNSDGASLSTGTGVRVYANSAGFMGGYASSSHSRSCVLLAQHDGEMQRDYWYDSRRHPDWLASAEAVGQKATQRTLARLGPTRPATGHYPVLFAPEVATGLLKHFISAIHGGRLYRKASFLCDRLGERLFPDWVTLEEHPLAPGLNASAPFDSCGLPTRQQAFVRDGVLCSYVLGLYSARRLGMTPTGNGSGVHNLRISHGEDDFSRMLQRLDRGILITELMGQGVNLVTGDYSRGASGFWVEQGQISRPLSEFTVAGNLADMFASLEAAGSDLDTRGRIHCGSLLLPALKIAGV